MFERDGRCKCRGKQKSPREAKATIAWGMTTKTQSLGNGQLALGTSAEERFSLLRSVLKGYRGQLTSYSIGEFFTKHGPTSLTRVNSLGSGMLNTSLQPVP
jgi:hypothetical protein